MSTLRILFASDLHGSTLIFKKLVNAALIYNADIIVIGGDITGKGIVPIVRKGSTYETTIYGTLYKVEQAGLQELIDKASSFGFYPYIVEDSAELVKLDNENEFNKILEDLMKKRIIEWSEFVKRKLAEKKLDIYLMPGNDDPYVVDDAIAESGVFINHARRVIELDEGYVLLGYDKANITPWRCPRDYDEEVLKKELVELVSKVEDTSKLILNTHCPPYNTTLDLAPKLDENLKPVTSGGGMVFEHVGCRSVREIIEEYQPLIGLHGHIHESRSIDKIGRTTIVNPGSAYNEGVLYASLILLDKGKVKSVALIKG